MDALTLKETLRLARAAEQVGCLPPGAWPDLAVALILEGVDDPEIAELAGLDRHASGWTVDPLTGLLYQRHKVPALDSEAAVKALATLMAADLQARPASVTGPMIRILARLAQMSDFGSALANECYGTEEYLDCDCVGRLDPALEAELERLPAAPLPDAVVRVLAAPLRATLPTRQPPHGH